MLPNIIKRKEELKNKLLIHFSGIAFYPFVILKSTIVVFPDLKHLIFYINYFCYEKPIQCSFIKNYHYKRSQINCSSSGTLL